MRNVYQSTTFLDKRACERYFLTPELLMENAACALETLIESLTHKGSVITILCGSGDNGGDGYALARHLSGEYKVRIYQVKEPKSPLCQLSYQRACECEVKFISKILPCDVVVDCVFGSGFKGVLDVQMSEIFHQAHKMARIRIACDLPSGLNAEFCEDKDNQSSKSPIFKADYTLSMGGLKLCSLSDSAKDYVGELRVANLGLSSLLYEVSSHIKLLEQSDFAPPLRDKQNVHKGDFGYVAVLSGENQSAPILSAQSALSFGVGYVSLVGENLAYVPAEIIPSPMLPSKATSIILGMGLGKDNIESKLEIVKSAQLPCVLDADVFHHPAIKDFLDSIQQDQRLDCTPQIVLTPHPKEFASLFHLCGLGAYDPRNRVESMLKFTQKYPSITLLLKGANVFIARGQEVYINTLGTQALAKGGSGDVLSGLIGALLAQGYDSLQSAIQGSLAHTLGAQKVLKKVSNYALTPSILIESISTL